MEIPQQQQAVHDLTVDAGVGMHPSNQPPFPAAAVAQPLLLERGSSALSPVRLDADSDEEGEGGDENSASPNVLAPHRAAPPPVKKPDTPYLLEVKIPGQKLPRGEAAPSSILPGRGSRSTGYVLNLVVQSCMWAHPQHDSRRRLQISFQLPYAMEYIYTIYTSIVGIKIEGCVHDTVDYRL